MQKIIILDQSDSSVHVFDFDVDIYGRVNVDIEVFYDHINDQYNYHFKDSQCSYMLVDELNIQIH